ncbi:hypothetical protein X943_000662 [Babesia divergens]|uniref:Uncharacterized protein n=1 Tax=Babesia divergens TaxID=32595 RepID=A0AAD9LK76_BABDI|nr:hypothetical protein X943_000662 [Babesia divergens]
MNIAYLLSLVTAALVEADPEVSQAGYTTVYCGNSMVKKGSNVPMEICRDVCFNGAIRCRRHKSKTYDYTHAGGIEVDGNCFIKSAGYSNDCIFPYEHDVISNLPIVSGYNVVAAGQRKTIALEGFTKPIVFAQAIDGRSGGHHGKVVISDVTTQSFTFNVDGKADFVYGVAWFVIEQDIPVESFYASHVHIEKVAFNGNHVVRITNPQYTRRSNNIAMFVQELTPNVDAVLKMTVTNDVIEVNITSVKQGEDTDQPLEREVEMALLFVDMDYFKSDANHMFGNMPISFLTPQSRNHDVIVPVRSDTKPLVFYTPYYNRVGDEVPSASCSWTSKSQAQGFFTCQFEPSSLVTLFPIGPPNVIFLAMKRIDKITETDRSFFKYGICSNAYSAVKGEAKPKSSYNGEETGAIEQPEAKEQDDDMYCAKLCVIRNRLCKDDLPCLRKYMGPSCAISDDKSNRRNKGGEELPLPTFLSPLIFLKEELNGTLCPGMFKAMQYKDVDDNMLQFIDEIWLHCQENNNNITRKNVVGIVDNHIAKNFCIKVLASLPVEWTPLETLRSQYIQNGVHLPLKKILSGYVVFSFCEYDDEMKMMTYYEYSKAAEPSSTASSVDCIETEWEEWSSCSGDCIPLVGQTLKRRVRSVLRFPVGDGRKCVTEETKACTLEELRSCKGMCVVTEWSEWGNCFRSTRVRRRYVRRYTEECDTMNMMEQKACKPTKGQQDAHIEDEEDTETMESLDGPDNEYQDADNEGQRGMDDYVEASTSGHQTYSYKDNYDLEHQMYEYMREHDGWQYNYTDPWNVQHEMHEGDPGAMDEEEKHFSGGIFNAPEPGASPQIYDQDEEISEGESLLETEGTNTHQNCTIWSDWSGCSSMCNDEEGYRYRISSIDQPDNIYSTCHAWEKQPCTPTEDCGLSHSINCDQVRSVYYNETDDAECREDCALMMEHCRDDGQNNYMECLTKLKAKSEYADFFFRCLLPHEQKGRLELLEKVFKNKCFITKAVYSDAKNSWKNEETQSCFCSIPGAVPCTAKDVHYNREEIHADMVDSGFCPIMDHKLSFFVPGHAGGKPDSMTYVSLAGNKRMHCPLDISNREVVTYTDFGNEKLEDYCQHGPLYAYQRSRSTSSVKQYEHKYNCDTAVSNSGISDTECRLLCRSVRVACLSKHEPYLKCIKDRLLVESEHEAGRFSEYGCRLPPTLDVFFDEDYYRVYVTSFETDPSVKKACSLLVHNAILQCEAQDMLKNRDSLSKCMASKLEDTHVTPKGPTLKLFQMGDDAATKFKSSCRFDPSLKGGRGYVMCKFPTETENYESWSEWSACSAACNDFDNIATRYRTRKVAKHAENSFFPGGLGTLQFGLCLHLGGCEGGRWVDSINEADNRTHILNYKAYMQNLPAKVSESPDHTYNRYPELRNEISTGATCQIFKSIKIVSYTGVTCGCPKKHAPCSFATAMSNPMWMEGMQNFCQDRPLASIGFQGELSNYKYYCNIGMLLAPIEYGSTPACDYYDNNEYVACETADEEPITLRTKHFTFMGVCLGLMFSAYAVLMRIVNRRRLRDMSVNKDE